MEFLKQFEYVQLNTLKVECIRGTPAGPEADKRGRPSRSEFLGRLRSIADDAQTSPYGRRRIYDVVLLVQSDPSSDPQDLWSRLRSPDPDVLSRAQCEIIDDLLQPNADEIRVAAKAYDHGYRAEAKTSQEHRPQHFPVENVSDQAGVGVQDQNSLSRSHARGQVGSASPEADKTVRFAGPDDVYFVVEQYPQGYTCHIHNDGLKACDKVRISVVNVQSFHFGKSAFREPERCDARWLTISDLRSGRPSKPERFVCFDQDRLRLGNVLGSGDLLWPVDVPEQRWLIHMRIAGLSREWRFDVELTWTADKSTLSIAEGNAIENGPVNSDGPNPPGKDFPPVASPYPPGHPLYEVWERLSPKLRESIGQMSLENLAEVRELDGKFQAAFANTVSLDRLEEYCLQRFDVLANHLLVVSISPDPTTLNPLYESFLSKVDGKIRDYLGVVLGSVRSDAREEIISRVALKLSGRKSRWLAEAAKWRLQGCSVRSKSALTDMWKVEPYAKPPDQSLDLRFGIGAEAGQVKAGDSVNGVDLTLGAAERPGSGEREDSNGTEEWEGTEGRNVKSAQEGDLSAAGWSREYRAPIQASGRGRGADESTGSSESGTDRSRGGRRPDAVRTEAIRTAISRWGERWRDHLPEILKELDDADTRLGDLLGKKIDLGDGKFQVVEKWEHLDLAQGADRRRILDALRKYLD